MKDTAQNNQRINIEENNSKANDNDIENDEKTFEQRTDPDKKPKT